MAAEDWVSWSHTDAPSVWKGSRIRGISSTGIDTMMRMQRVTGLSCTEDVPICAPVVKSWGELIFWSAFVKTLG